MPSGGRETRLLSLRPLSWPVAVLICLSVMAGLLAWRNALHLSDKEALHCKADICEGSWHFPRGGPYILGFQSKSAAKLYVDGKLVAQGKGQVLKRLVYSSGDYRVKIEGGDGAFRLLWHPPGRRGPPEYVPNSSLSAKTESASFTFPGRSITDGIFALLLLFSPAALLAFLFRQNLKSWFGNIKREDWIGLAIVFGAALFLRLFGLNEQGQTWDEDVNWSAGRNYITNLLSFDFRDESWRWNYEHPPVMKYIAGIGAQFSDGYSASRFLSVLQGSVVCVLSFAIAKRLWGKEVALLAGLFAAFNPHMIAHSKVVGHEVTSMLWWSLAIWLSVRAFDKLEHKYSLHRRFALLGVVLGIAIFSRYINGLMAPLIGVILLVQSPPAMRKKTLLLGISIIPIVALLTCIVVWPRMWSEPLVHLQESWNKLKKPHSLEPFLGQMTNKPGGSYFFVYLWATAPIGILVFAKLWLARLVHRREKESILLLLWLLLPMVVSFSPVRQDGVRYIMPSLMAMNISAALGVDYLRTLAPTRFLGFFRATIPSVFALYLLVVCVRIHPFYLDYYGEQVGGPKSVAAQKKFEIAWWGEGMNKALDYLNRKAEADARVYKACFQPGHLAWMRGDLWKREARRAKDADWILVYQPSARPCPIPSSAELVHEVKAQGAVLAEVWKLPPSNPKTLPKPHSKDRLSP